MKHIFFLIHSIIFLIVDTYYGYVLVTNGLANTILVLPFGLILIVTMFMIVTSALGILDKDNK